MASAKITVIVPGIELTAACWQTQRRKKSVHGSLDPGAAIFVSGLRATLH